MRVAVIIGTRPEAIKMAPVQRALIASQLEPVLVSTGQHQNLLRTALRPLGLEPNIDLDLMTVGQTPNMIASRVLDALPAVLTRIAPSAVLVQGDTTTAMASALASYHLRIPVGHVEAGLRTYDDQNPFPEEANRQLLARVARWHFAPTELARTNLLAERIRPESIYVTGNTGVDSLLWMAERHPRPSVSSTVLMTLHRRESLGAPLRGILKGVREFLDVVPEAHITWPVHPNPEVLDVAREVLGEHARVSLCEPLEYDAFARALLQARVVLSDSGGVQEEAPSLGKRVLIARDVTERPEAVDAGLNRLVGRDATNIRESLVAAWGETPFTGALPAPNPFGDGRAALRIVQILADQLANA
jgi:UDP-N-acetylglucosamine 2-epimerase (non-hydrolysing)